jgi:hypothetical protein
MMASGFQNTNAFQNAGQHGYFSYYEKGNQSSTFVILLLALILLIALLSSEARYRKLLERFALNH